jgi:hypothetical protein
MALGTIRKPEVSLGLGLATGAVVYGTWQFFVPNQSDVRVGKPGDETLEKARKQAAWFSAAIVGGISLIAKDATIFIVGGIIVVALDWATRANNFTNPVSGRIEVGPVYAGFGTESREQVSAEPSSGGGYEGLMAVN